MKYVHFFQANGDGIMKNILKIRERMGNSLTENM